MDVRTVVVFVSLLSEIQLSEEALSQLQVGCLEMERTTMFYIQREVPRVLDQKHTGTMAIHINGVGISQVGPVRVSLVAWRQELFLEATSWIPHLHSLPS